MTENLKKKSYQFLKYARAYLRKGRYAPADNDSKWSQGVLLFLLSEKKDIV